VPHKASSSPVRATVTTQTAATAHRLRENLTPVAIVAGRVSGVVTAHHRRLPQPAAANHRRRPHHLTEPDRIIISDRERTHTSRGNDLYRSVIARGDSIPRPVAVKPARRDPAEKASNHHRGRTRWAVLFAPGFRVDDGPRDHHHRHTFETARDRRLLFRPAAARVVSMPYDRYIDQLRRSARVSDL